MTDSNSTVNTTKQCKNRISLYLVLFGIIGVILAVFMAYCQVNHTHTAQIGNGEILRFSHNGAEDTSFARIITYFEDSAAVTVLTVCTVLAILISLIVPAFTMYDQPL